MDTIYLVEYDLITDHLVIIHLCKQFDEDYDETMYIGSDMEDQYGYFLEDVYLDEPIFNSTTCLQYFTDNIDNVENSIVNSKSFEFFKSIKK